MAQPTTRLIISYNWFYFYGIIHSININHILTINSNSILPTNSRLKPSICDRRWISRLPFCIGIPCLGRSTIQIRSQGHWHCHDVKKPATAPNDRYIIYIYIYYIVLYIIYIIYKFKGYKLVQPRNGRIPTGIQLWTIIHHLVCISVRTEPQDDKMTLDRSGPSAAT